MNCKDPDLKKGSWRWERSIYSEVRHVAGNSASQNAPSKHEKLFSTCRTVGMSSVDMQLKPQAVAYGRKVATICDLEVMMSALLYCSMYTRC
jgi:hypothetical protein